MSLGPEDRRQIESLPFDPLATISYHELAGCLVWSDEIPEGLSAAGYDYVRDLLSARGFMHRGIPPDSWPTGAEGPLAERWGEAHGSGLRWNGFQRLVLTPPQRAAFERFRADDREL